MSGKEFGLGEGVAIVAGLVVAVGVTAVLVKAVKGIGSKPIQANVNLPQAQQAADAATSAANTVAHSIDQATSAVLPLGDLVKQAAQGSGDLAASGKGLIDAATASLGTLTDAAQGALYSADDAAKSAQGAFDAFGGGAKAATNVVSQVMQKAQTVLQHPGAASIPGAVQAATKATQLGQQAAQVLQQGGDPSTLLNQGIQFANQAQQMVFGTKTA